MLTEPAVDANCAPALLISDRDVLAETAILAVDEIVLAVALSMVNAPAVLCIVTLADVLWSTRAPIVVIVTENRPFIVIASLLVIERVVPAAIDRL
jgi:hypothetical protein